MNKEVAIYVKDKDVLEQLKNSLASPLTFVDSPPIKNFMKDHFVICDVKTLLEKTKDFSEIDKNLLYVLSNQSDEENMKLVEEHGLHHLVGHNESVFAQEIIASLKKGLSKKLWGLEPYMDNEEDIRTISLSDSKHTNELVHDALLHFDFKDYFSSPHEYIQVMANELISNSLYKGPNLKRQEKGLESINRKDPVFLKGSDLVQVSLGMDAKGIALSVQDSFGGLSYELLIKSLKRSFQEKTVMDKKDGAGLGLYLTYLHSNQFIINFKENYRTEVICIIDKNKRYKNYKQRIRSFHFFQEVSSEKTNH